MPDDTPITDSAQAIDRDFVPAGAQNYAQLRELGLARIQATSGATWTNHNSPDPGISIMEALAYAISDLAYRNGFAMRDLLTRPDGRIGPASETGLFPAQEVLTTSPVTIADHRRLLLRIDGVRNAWLDPMTDPEEPDNYRLAETPIFADCVADALSHEALNAAGDSNHPVKVSGLYRVLVELDIDERLGSLNETALEFTFQAGPLKGLIASIDYSSPIGPAFEQPALAEPVAPDAVSIQNAVAAGNGIEFTADFIVEQDGAEIARLEGMLITILEDRPTPTADPVTVTLTDLETALARTGPDGPAARFLQKREARRRAMNAVCRVLHAHRPLCEDYLAVRTVTPHRVGVCADIDVKPDADLEEVQALVLHAIETYLSPPPVFQTLDALLEQGLAADEIFEGPYVDFTFTVEGRPAFTQPGFITDADLDACELRRLVHASDLINIIVDLPGVLAVRNLTLRAYDEQGVPVGDTQQWTLEVPPERQPTHYFAGTKLTLFKNELPYRAQPTESEQTLAHLRALARSQLYVPADQVLPAVMGQWRALDEIFTVQNDLPRVYGVDEAGLPVEASRERIARARQLKAYLTVFDQAMADFIGQLANARRLFSPDKTLEQTWFPPYLDTFPGTRGDFPGEFYIGAGDPGGLADERVRVRLTETEEAFLDRRARVLNHLIARFAERFGDYALISHQLSGDRLRTERELLDDRADFLADYPAVSRARGQAFNQLPEDPAQLWDSDNISGLQRRVARLLGIDDPSRRDLHCTEVFPALFGTRAQAGQFSLTVRGPGATRLFTSEESFPTRDAALAAARPLEFRMRAPQTYTVDPSGGTGAVRLRLSGGGASFTDRRMFDTEADAVAAARAILERHNRLLQSDICNSEGMHLIEHILLRPRNPGDRLMQVCLSEDCSFCGEEDPYSFRISVLLPYWPRRFQDLNFRRFAERVIREETPAHIHARICWIDNADMLALDTAHREWREALASKPVDAPLLSTRAQTLIEVLESLRTVYPPATLHDCDEGGDDDNIVRLGETNLGLF
jgi:hypothetical protein